jgi:outer membrane protein assembly factor BamB
MFLPRLRLFKCNYLGKAKSQGPLRAVETTVMGGRSLGILKQFFSGVRFVKARFLTLKVFSLVVYSVLGAGCLSLTGCDSLKGLVEKKKTPLKGKRRDVVSVVQEDEGAFHGKELEEPLCLPRPVFNQEWLQLNQRSSHRSSNIYFKWHKDLKEVWRAQVQGNVAGEGVLLSSFVAEKGRLYLLDTLGHVKCFSLGQGQELWCQSVMPCDGDGKKKGYGLGGGVACDGKGYLYVGTSYGEMLALKVQSGAIVWRKDLLAPVRSGPMVHQCGLFIMNICNQMEVVSAKDGQSLWSYDGAIEGTILLGLPTPGACSGPEGDLIFVPSLSGDLVAYSGLSGRLVWSENFVGERDLQDHDGAAFKASPVVAGSYVYGVTCGGVLSCLDFRNGNLKWTKNEGSIYTPCVVGNGLFLINTNGELVCLNRLTGKCYWRMFLPKTEKGLIDHWTDPLCLGGFICSINSSGVAYAFDPMKKGCVAFSYPLEEPVSCAPIVVGGVLFVLTDKGSLISLKPQR